MYTIIWLIMDMIIFMFGFDFRTGVYWVIQAIFIIGMLIRENR